MISAARCRPTPIRVTSSVVPKAVMRPRDTGSCRSQPTLPEMARISPGGRRSVAERQAFSYCEFLLDAIHQGGADVQAV